MRSAAAAPRGPTATIQPRRFAATRWPGRRSFPRPVRRGGRGGSDATPGPYPSAAPPPPGPGPPPSGLRSPPSASDCFGSNGNGGSAFQPGSRRLLGFSGPPRPFVVLLLPLAGPGVPPAAPTRASPLGARASPPRSGVSSARPAPGCPRPACGPVYGPLTMSLKPQQQQQQPPPPAAASARKPGGGLLSSPAAAPSPSSPSVSSSSAAASSSSAAAASAGGGRPGLGRWVSRPRPLCSGPGQARASRPLPRGPHSRPRPVTRWAWGGGLGARSGGGAPFPSRAWGVRWGAPRIPLGMSGRVQPPATPAPPPPNGQDGRTGQPPPLHLSVWGGLQVSAIVSPGSTFLRPPPPPVGYAWAAHPPPA